jgi:hypothetical protein
LTEIADKNEAFDLNLDVSVANKLLTALNECSEYVLFEGSNQLPVSIALT